MNERMVNVKKKGKTKGQKPQKEKRKKNKDRRLDIERLDFR